MAFIMRWPGLVLVIALFTAQIATINGEEPDCPAVACQNVCVGSQRCPKCSIPCTAKCPAGKVCELRVIPCLIPPCPVRPICVSEDPCTGTPNDCECKPQPVDRFTFNSSTGTCKKFRYNGCTPSPNTFSTLKQCTFACNPPFGPGPVCITVECDINCYTFKRRNRCPKCVCPDPCRGPNKCDDGYECKLLEVTGTADEKPQPFCVPKPCPKTKPCNIRCAYGLKTDPRGCPLCQCKPKP